MKDFDFRDLRTVRQIVDESRYGPNGEATLKPGTIRDWIFFANENGFHRCIVRIGRRVYVHVPRFNDWIAERFGRMAS